MDLNNNILPGVDVGENSQSTRKGLDDIIWGPSASESDGNVPSSPFYDMFSPITTSSPSVGENRNSFVFDGINRSTQNDGHPLQSSRTRSTPNDHQNTFNFSDGMKQSIDERMESINMQKREEEFGLFIEEMKRARFNFILSTMYQHATYLISEHRNGVQYSHHGQGEPPFDNWAHLDRHGAVWNGSNPLPSHYGGSSTYRTNEYCRSVQYSHRGQNDLQSSNMSRSGRGPASSGHNDGGFGNPMGSGHVPVFPGRGRVQPVSYSGFSVSSHSWNLHAQTFQPSRPRYRTISASSGGSSCGYCKSVGEEWEGHSKSQCPRLATLKPCRICGASGYDNHTEIHCPLGQKTVLPLRPDFIREADERKRKRQQGKNGYGSRI